MKIITYSTKIALATLCAATWMGASASAANPDRLLNERATINGIDPQAKTLTVTDRKSHAAQVFVWNDSTKFLEKDHRLSKAHPVSANDLKPGERVYIRYQNEQNQMLARSVVIMPEHHASTKSS